jgi:hypothetical protein
MQRRHVNLPAFFCFNSCALGLSNTDYRAFGGYANEFINYPFRQLVLQFRLAWFSSPSHLAVVGERCHAAAS